jgi:hypothetical protein
VYLSSGARITVCGDPCRIPTSASAVQEFPASDPYAMRRNRDAFEENIERKLGNECLNVH